MKEEGTDQPWSRRQSFPGLRAEGLYCPERPSVDKGGIASPAYFPRDSLDSWWPAEKGESGSLAWLHRVFLALRMPAMEGRGTASLACFPLA